MTSTSPATAICLRSGSTSSTASTPTSSLPTVANAQDSGRSTLPNYQVMNRQNLGYSGQMTLNIPVWNWGVTRSKVRQAEFKEAQAKLDLSLAERTLQGNLAAAYAEARAAQAQLDSLRSSVDLSVESLRLTLLRYQAGEAARARSGGRANHRNPGAQRL